MWTVIVRDAAGNIHSKTQLKTGVITLGRSTDCDIVLLSAAVSRLHGRLLVGGGPMLVYSDERSANGSLLDGRPVDGAVDVGVNNVIRVGEFSIGFECEGVHKASPSAELNATVIFRPGELELIAQSPPPSKPAAPARPPTTAEFMTTQVRPQTPPPPPAQRAAPAVPPPAAGGLKSALPGFEFKDLDQIRASAPIEPPKPQTLSESLTGLLDQQIRGIQSHREAQRESELMRARTYDQQWDDAIIAARDLQAKLKGDARVLYYVITRGNDEISVKLADSSRRGHVTLSLAKRHPETGKQTEGVVWFTVFGEDPRPYREPKLALEDFVRRIAAKLA